MLLSRFYLRNPINLRRARCIAFTPFILAFIAFNILDLDGSELISFSKNFEVSIFIGDVDPTPRIDSFSEYFELPNVTQQLAPDPSRNEVLSPAQILKFSLIRTARHHGYRVGLARHSLPNASPDL
jgi:hypothetical protein